MALLASARVPSDAASGGSLEGRLGPKHHCSRFSNESKGL